MDLGILGKRYSFALTNNAPNSRSPQFYVGDLLEEDDLQIKIKDRFGLIVIIRKDQIIRMKELVGDF